MTVPGFVVDNIFGTLKTSLRMIVKVIKRVPGCLDKICGH